MALLTIGTPGAKTKAKPKASSPGAGAAAQKQGSLLSFFKKP